MVSDTLCPAVHILEILKFRQSSGPEGLEQGGWGLGRVSKGLGGWGQEGTMRLGSGGMGRTFV